MGCFLLWDIVGYVYLKVYSDVVYSASLVCIYVVI